MQKRAPTLGNILVIMLFALSCFGLLLFLWESFGGPLPLKPKGYRFTVAFPRTLALAEQSDVRISGVNVGHVIALQARQGRHDPRDGRNQPANTRRCASNMHAILRQKTLLGETYVQLIPAGPARGPLPAPTTAQLADSQVEPSVTLDDILASFDPKTRRAFKIWQQSLAAGINGRGEQINADFAELEPFAENANKLVTHPRLPGGRGARRWCTTPAWCSTRWPSRDRQLEGLIVNGEHTFHAAAEASQAFAEAFRVLPPFERNSTDGAAENSTSSPRSPARSSKSSARPSASCPRCWRRRSRSRPTSTAS